MEREPGNVRFPKPKGEQVFKKSGDNRIEDIGGLSEEDIILVERLHRGCGGCGQTPKMLWNLPTWRYLKAIWTSPWATGSRWSFLSLLEGLDQITPGRPFQPQLFCDSVKVCL